MSDKRLWSVTITVPMVVVAAGPAEAVQIALSHYREEDGGLEGSYASDAVEITSRRDLPGDWDTFCFPWGENGSKTVAAYLREVNRD